MTIETELTRRTIYLQRFAAFLVNEYVNKTIQSISKQLPEMLAIFAADTDLTRRERDKLFNDFLVKFRSSWVDMYDPVTGELADMSIIEQKAMAEVYADLANVDLSVPAEVKTKQLIAAATLVLDGGNSVLSGTWAQLIGNDADAATRAIQGVITQGFQQGWTMSQYLQQLRGTYNRSTKEYVGGLLTKTQKRHAETLIRTGVMHYANQATELMGRANKNVITFREYVATLDNRTTTGCYALDGTRWDIDDDNYVRVPRHPRCRSRHIYGGPGIDTGVMRPAVGGKSNNPADYLKKPKYTGRKSLDVYSVEQVPVGTSAEDWLREQPLAWLESSQAFGKAKARLFKEGKIGLSDMLDFSGQPLTLEEIKAIKPSAFREGK